MFERHAITLRYAEMEIRIYRHPGNALVGIHATHIPHRDPDTVYYEIHELTEWERLDEVIERITHAYFFNPDEAEAKDFRRELKNEINLFRNYGSEPGVWHAILELMFNIESYMPLEEDPTNPDPNQTVERVIATIADRLGVCSECGRYNCNGSCTPKHVVIRNEREEANARFAAVTWIRQTFGHTVAAIVATRIASYAGHDDAINADVNRLHEALTDAIGSDEAQRRYYASLSDQPEDEARQAVARLRDLLPPGAFAGICRGLERVDSPDKSVKNAMSWFYDHLMNEIGGQKGYDEECNEAGITHR